MKNQEGGFQEELKEKVAVVGASGYIANRLIPALLSKGHRVVACARRPENLRGRPWAEDKKLTLAAVDALDGGSLTTALAGCNSAFYLVHSMNPREADFAEADRNGAGNMVRASKDADVSRIIYLGGLGEEGPALSKHLRSRAEVGKILQGGAVPVTVLRAAMIIGSGSASFEILRYLVKRLFIMVTPRWVNTESQPIAVSNVIGYLLGCLEAPGTAGNTFDIGGPEVVTYRGLIDIFAKEAGLRVRMALPLPLLTPKLFSYWIHLVTPVPSYIARPLAEGLRNRTVCENHGILKLVPQELLSCREAIRRALENPQPGPGGLPMAESLYPGDADWAGGSRSE